MPLWTIEVFTDPSACADRIGGYLGLEQPVRHVPAVASPGFFDEDVTGLDDDSYGPAPEEDGQFDDGLFEDRSVEDGQDQDADQDGDGDRDADGEDDYDAGLPDRKENAQ
jgi:hypothetical protein